jgi:hypothetical protein
VTVKVDGNPNAVKVTADANGTDINIAVTQQVTNVSVGVSADQAKAIAQDVVAPVVARVASVEQAVQATVVTKGTSGPDFISASPYSDTPQIHQLREIKPGEGADYVNINWADIGVVVDMKDRDNAVDRLSFNFDTEDAVVKNMDSNDLVVVDKVTVDLMLSGLITASQDGDDLVLFHEGKGVEVVRFEDTDLSHIQLVGQSSEAFTFTGFGG